MQPRGRVLPGLHNGRKFSAPDTRPSRKETHLALSAPRGRFAARLAALGPHACRQEIRVCFYLCPLKHRRRNRRFFPSLLFLDDDAAAVASSACMLLSSVRLHEHSFDWRLLSEQRLIERLSGWRSSANI
jgi:hypothetical protein